MLESWDFVLRIEDSELRFVNNRCRNIIYKQKGAMFCWHEHGTALYFEKRSLHGEFCMLV